MAIWAFNGRSLGQYHGKRGMILDVIKYYQPHFHEASCLIGDFNNGPEIRKGKTWTPAVAMLNENRMRPVVFPGRKFTHIQRGKEYQIDHCFLGSKLIPAATAIPLLDFKKVPSDHVPLIIDFVQP
jgi:endonuclease/exonuclease/phosphatase family metal-dependent hydrolase